MSTTAPSVGLAPMFSPAGVAVVGASQAPGKLGTAMLSSLDAFARTGRTVAPVNHRDETFYASLQDAAATEPIDLAIVCIPATACPDIVDEAAAAGVRAVMICSGGFAEAGGTGVDLQQRLVERAQATGVRVLGPNTSGFIVPGTGLTASFVPGASAVAPGKIAIVAASGGVNHALAFLLAEAGHGVSVAVGLGNAIDVTASDVLDHLATDPSTSAVALHIESVADGTRLVNSVRRLTDRTPVVALVVGRNDVSAFASSHTGALATSWRTTRAALAQAGAVVVDDERELVDAVGALAVTRARPCANPSVGIVTAQAGPGLLLLDDLRGRLVDIPELTTATQEQLATWLPPLTYQRNPVDTGRPGPDLGRVLATVARDPASDVVAGYALVEPGAVDLVAAASEGQVEGVPCVFGVGGTTHLAGATRTALIEAGIATAVDPTGVANATAALLADARAQYRRVQGATADPPTVPHLSEHRYDEAQAKDLLDQMGVRTTAREICTDRASAHLALERIGGPVAVKLLDATILHKTDIGGVHLDVRSREQLDLALDALESAGASQFLIEGMAQPGIDLIVGAHRDPVFGPIVLLGLGGVEAEVIADAAVRLAPLSRADAIQMRSDLAGRRLLDGWRNGPIADRDELADVLIAIGQLMVKNPHLDVVEINPLRVGADGLVALDAVITRTRSLNNE